MSKLESFSFWEDFAFSRSPGNDVNSSQLIFPFALINSAGEKKLNSGNSSGSSFLDSSFSILFLRS